MSEKGKLYLIPTTLGEGCETLDVIPQRIYEVVNLIDEYIVENEKWARRYLKRVGFKGALEDVVLYPLNEHTKDFEISGYLNGIDLGKNIGIISEAGCPAVADPGSEVVKLAHRKNIVVVPLVGPSSILLALMGSGFNGQNFTFNGYLPKERGERIVRIKEMARVVLQKNVTQLFIETPYRNMHLLEDILGNCDEKMLLCIACDLTLPSEFIVTKSVFDWRKKLPDINKRPTIFVFGK